MNIFTDEPLVFVWLHQAFLDNVEGVRDQARALDASFNQIKRSANLEADLLVKE